MQKVEILRGVADVAKTLGTARRHGYGCAGLKGPPIRGLKEVWLRGVDSNHDSQIQSLESYQLDDPGVAARSLAEGNNC